ncbi:hypothetical protein J4232_05705 [Candidatus Woesearchaeota archaeon]|nr:hypothetical protein [Candidatus Woesearchaeota archaeon]
MYYYIKYKKPTSSKTLLFRRNARIVVFSKDNAAKTAKKELEENGMFSVKVLHCNHSPATRDCQLFGRKFEKVGW